MSKPVFNVHFMGRFGNMAVQYLFARGYCEKHNLEMHTDPWVGEKIFQITPSPIKIELPRFDENTLVDGMGNVSYRSYSQQQKCVTYTQRQAREWLAFRPEVADALKVVSPVVENCCAHVRRGDYPGYGYPLVAVKSYEDFAMRYGIPKITYITEENPLRSPDFFGELDMLPDFYRLCTCDILLRANSTFSWVAGLLNEGRVFSPLIADCEGGKEHHCEFVTGNWPRFANLGFTTDMIVKP